MVSHNLCKVVSFIATYRPTSPPTAIHSPLLPPPLVICTPLLSPPLSLYEAYSCPNSLSCSHSQKQYQHCTTQSSGCPCTHRPDCDHQPSTHLYLCPCLGPLPSPAPAPTLASETRGENRPLPLPIIPLPFPIHRSVGIPRLSTTTMMSMNLEYNANFRFWD